MHVQKIGDQLGVSRMGQRRADNPRRPVMQGRHGVEHMGDAVAPAFETAAGRLVVARRMADLNPHAAI